MAPRLMRMDKTSMDRNWASIILCIMIMALIIYTIAFAIPYWAWLGSKENTKTHYGLWHECKTGKTVPVEGCQIKPRKQGEEWFLAVQVFGTITFLLMLAALGVLIAFMCNEGFSEKSVATEAIMGLICSSACALVITVMIFGNKHAVNSLSWSFALAVTALVFNAVACIVTFIAIRQAD